MAIGNGYDTGFASDHPQALQSEIGIESLELRARQVIDRLARCELQWAQLVYGPPSEIGQTTADIATPEATDRFRRVADNLDSAIQRLDALADRIAARQA